MALILLYVLFCNSGFKGSIDEGGTRVPAFIHSPLLSTTNYVSQALMHVTDWYPTILRIAGVTSEEIMALNIDGIDQYDTFFSSDATGDNRFVHK